MSWWYSPQLDRIEHVIHSLSLKTEYLMSLVQIDSAALDQLTADLTDIGTQLSAEIAALKTALPEADLSGVEAAVDALKALEVPAAPPAS